MFLLVSWNVALQAQNCPVATNLTVVDITASGARINFTLTPNTSTAVIEIYSTASPNFVAVGTTNSSSFLLTGLASSTIYHYRIKSECTGFSPSYSTTGEFKTLAPPATTTTLTAKGKVKISAGSACEKMIILDNNTVVVPVESVAFTYKDGQYVEIAYEVLKDRVITCKEGPAVKITKIAEIVVTPAVCTLPILLSKNSTTPVSYTFKTEAQPEGSVYYWYFGDNGTSDAASPTHTYAAGGTYTVNLKVKDKTGKVCYGEMKETFLGGTVNPTLTAKGKVKISAGSACEKMIILDNNTVVVPVESVAFTYKDGQYVEIAYEVLKDRVITCKEGPAVKITKIAEIVIAPTVCTIPITLTKNSTTPVSYTFKTSTQPDGVKYYWYFGDNGTSDAASPTHTYATGGTYTVNLKVLDATGKVCYGEMKETFLGGTVNPTLTAKGKVKISAGSACEKMIILDNNTVVVPVESVAFTYKDGQYVEIAYEVLKDKVITCKEGPAVKITKIAEIMVTPVTCTAASNVTATEITASGARINFTLPKDIAKAALEIKEYNTTTWLTSEFTSLTLTYFDRKELKAATKYYYHIKTVCANGSVNYSPDAYFVTASAAASCAAASNVTVSEITSTGARINFTLPKDITKAALEIKEYNTTTWLTSEFSGVTLTYFDRKELKAATKYYYHIKTVCANGSVNYSPDAYFVTASATSTTGNCTAATGLSVANIGPNGVKIIYVLPTGISSATLEVINANTTNTDASAWLSKNIVIPSNYTERGDLLPSTKYKFRIKTICANGGAVTYSALGDFTTSASKTVVPACLASNISVSDITSSGARINFKLPSEIITASLEIIVSNTTEWLSFPIDNTTNYYLLTSLEPLTGYYYRIKTVCSDGTFNFTPNAKFATTGNKNAEITDGASSADNSNDLTISCFPNPASSSITVNVMSENDQQVNVKLSSVYGKVVFESQFPGNVAQEINVKNYPKGIYVLKVSNGTKTSSVKIVIN